MRDSCYIVLSEYGIERMTKRSGALKRGEISVRVSLTVPDKCFTDPPIDAEIVVPENAIIRPTVAVEVHEVPELDE